MYTLARKYANPSKLTVIITTYPKYYQYLQLALASIDYAHTDIIITNDSDVPIDVVGEHLKVINRTVSEKWGTSTARNIGWQNAETDLVIYLDGDDLFFPGALEAMHWYYQDILAKSGESHVIYGNLIRSDMNTVWIPKLQYRGTDYKQSAVVARNSVMPYCCLIPVNVLEQVGGYQQTATWEEIVFEADLWLHNIKATKIGVITYIYRWSKDGRRGSNDKQPITDAVQQFMYDRMYAFKRS